MRYFKATVEYDGTDFSGFQWQHETRTVQGELEAALLKRTGQTVRVTGAGRTDRGVHALGQVVSFCAETSIPVTRMGVALNSVMPRDLCLTVVDEVDEKFSARFSASSRAYGYLILNREEPSALWRRYSALCREPLDVAAMRSAALILRGEQDFAGFTSGIEEDAVTLRNVMRCQIVRKKNMVVVRIEANAFLRNMVRVIVGTLIDVGIGKRSPDSIRQIIESRDRRQAGPTAPPQGLCLLKVHYGVRIDYGRKEIIE